MGITIVRERFTLPTATTDPLDLTTTKLGGLTPKAAMLIYPISGLSTDGTAVDGLVRGVGFMSSATAQTFSANSSAHGTTSSSTGIRSLTARVGEEITPATTIQQVFYADTDAPFITNGIRLTTSEIGTSTATFVEIIFFAGDDLSAAVTSTVLTNSVDTDHDITDPGFEPDLVISVAALAGGMGIGVVHNNRSGTITQRAMCHKSRNSRPTMEVESIARDNYGCVSPVNTWGSDTNCWLEFGTFDSSGFTITTRLNAPGSTSGRVQTLALRLGSGPLVNGKVWTFDTPTSTGDNTDTSPGFQPQFVMYLGSILEALATNDTGSLSASSSISTIDVTDAHSAAWSDEDGTADANTQSLFDDQAVNLPLANGSPGLAASFVGFTSTGVTLNWSDVETNAKKFFGLAIGAEVAAATSFPFTRKPNTLRRM